MTITFHPHLQRFTCWVFCLASFSLLAQKKSYHASPIFPLQDKHVHSSSLVALPNGDMLVCWFEGSGERTANDVAIKGARLKKGSAVWSKPFLLADTPGQPDCNPVFFINTKGQLVLYWIVVQANQWESSILKYRISSNFMTHEAPAWDWQDIILLKPDTSFENAIADGFGQMKSRGLTWAAYAPKYENMIIEAAKDKKKRETGWMTRIHPIVLPNGRILLPLYSDGFNLSLVGISDDDGKTWSPSLPIVGYGNIQPSIVQKTDGSLVAYMRDNGDAPGRIVKSTSSDNGYTWSAAQKTQLPNSGASVQLLTLKNGNWLLVHNDLEEGRYRLAVSLSEDEGNSWPWTRYLELDPKREGRFSYPSMVQTKDGLIHISYSYHLKDAKTIKHVTFPLKWMKKKK